MTQLISILINKNFWKFLVKIQLTKSDPKKDRGSKVPCLMPIRVKRQKSKNVFLPNCVSKLLVAVNTLVGIRGLLLSMKSLREQVVEPNYSQSGGTGHILETNFNDPIFFGVRRQKNSSNDNAVTPSNPVNNDGTLSPDEADARLRDRFLSLFFWPALMATIKPDERRYIFIPLISINLREYNIRE